jgi:hypothetical protein
VLTGSLEDRPAVFGVLAQIEAASNSRTPTNPGETDIA